MVCEFYIIINRLELYSAIFENHVSLLSWRVQIIWRNCSNFDVRAVGVVDSFWDDLCVRMCVHACRTYSEAERGIVGREVIYSRVWYRWTSLQSPLVEGTEIFMDSHG